MVAHPDLPGQSLYPPSPSADSSVHHPPHYNQHPTIECIDVVEEFTFNIGNAIKYLWRAGLKGDIEQDFRKAIWYIEREIQRLKDSS